jgi:hypothetical protein
MRFAEHLLDQNNISDVENSNFEILPNPNNGKFAIKSLIEIENSESVNFYVYDLAGKLLLKTKLKDNMNIDLSDYKEGIYVLKIIDSNGKVEVKKIFKQ